MMENKNSQQVACILTAQIVHELKSLPRGTTPEEVIVLLETAYKLGTAIEDVLKSAYKVRNAG